MKVVPKHRSCLRRRQLQNIHLHVTTTQRTQPRSRQPTSHQSSNQVHPSSVPEKETSTPPSTPSTRRSSRAVKAQIGDPNLARIGFACPPFPTHRGNHIPVRHRPSCRFSLLFGSGPRVTGDAHAGVTFGCFLGQRWSLIAMI